MPWRLRQKAGAIADATAVAGNFATMTFYCRCFGENAIRKFDTCG
jgi:hypothetical protein